MITLDKISPEFKTDHLLLLVGANPLPNYVVAYLLARQDTTIHILHSVETKDVASTLDGAISRIFPDIEPYFWQIDTTDSAEIAQEVKKILAMVGPRQSIGLHYTGGTKAMSVHTYRAIANSRADAVFTYLDAQTLALRIDGGENRQTQSIRVQNLCKVELDTLARLHGYDGFKKEPVKVGGQERIAIVDALLQIHLDVEGFTQWRTYLSLDRELTTLPDKASYPALQPFLDAVQTQCGSEATTSELAGLLGDKTTLKSYSKWLRSDWLEEHTLRCVQNIANEIAIDDWGMGIEPIRGRRKKASPLFEIDVGAMRGYQLYAISCMVSDHKDKCEEHFFESYIRSRQLGGDEARAALICFYDKPLQLETKIQESWLTSSDVRVFGREHLADLQIHLRDWFAMSNT